MTRNLANSENTTTVFGVDQNVHHRKLSPRELVRLTFSASDNKTIRVYQASIIETTRRRPLTDYRDSSYYSMSAIVAGFRFLMPRDAGFYF